MGFNDQVATQALINTNNNLQAATEILLSGS